MAVPECEVSKEWEINGCHDAVVPVNVLKVYLYPY